MTTAKHQETKCGSCNKMVLDTEEVLQREVCCFWHHIICESVDDDSYSVLTKQNLNILESADIHIKIR